MAYDLKLAEKVRAYLGRAFSGPIEEKSMFGGLAFLLNQKMCVNISGDRLMCRFDPDKTAEVSSKRGYEPMVMHGKKYLGYCYVKSDGFKDEANFSYWMNLCVSFNNRAKGSKAKKRGDAIENMKFKENDED